MKIRVILWLLCGLALAGCGQMGDSMSGLFGQSESPPETASPDAGPEGAGSEDGADDATDTDAGPGETAEEAVAASDETQAGNTPQVRERDLDPANTEILNSERVICEEKGGRWARAGSAKAFACVSNTRDGNKFCTAADQCEGYCLARSGTCSPFSPMFGCHDVISKNGGMQTVCVE